MSRAVQDALWLLRHLRPLGTDSLSEAALHALAHSLQRQTLEQGTVLFQEGTKPEGAWAVRTGSIELSTRLGGSRGIVQILRVGAIAGDLPILLDTHSLVTARVAEQGTFLFLDQATLMSLLESYTELSFMWLHNIGTELQGLRIRVLQLLGNNLEQSLARLLLEEEMEDRVSLSQSAIAEMLGVQRTSVNRALGELSARGVVKAAYGSVRILDRARLTAIAVGDAGPPSEDQPAPAHPFVR